METDKNKLKEKIIEGVKQIENLKDLQNLADITELLVKERQK